MSRKAVTGHIERGTVGEAVVRGPYGWVIVDADAAEQAILDATAFRFATADETEEQRNARINFEDPRTWPRATAGLRLVREWWIARHAKRKDDLAGGELVRTADVHRALFSATRLVRDQLLTFPDRVADDIAAELNVADATCVRNALRKSIERALSDLSSGLEQGLVQRPIEDDGDGGASVVEDTTDGDAG